MGRAVVRRTFNTATLTLADLRALAVEAHGAGLDDTSIVGFRPFYGGGRPPGGGWKVEITVSGEQAASFEIRVPKPRPMCPECRDGKCQNCTGWTLDDSDREVACRCPHAR